MGLRPVRLQVVGALLYHLLYLARRIQREMGMVGYSDVRTCTGEWIEGLTLKQRHAWLTNLHLEDFIASSCFPASTMLVHGLWLACTDLKKHTFERTSCLLLADLLTRVFLSFCAPGICNSGRSRGFVSSSDGPEAPGEPGV